MGFVRPACLCVVLACVLAAGPAACKGDSAVADAAQPAASGPTWRPGYVRPPIIDMHAHISAAGIERLRTIQRAEGIRLTINLSGGVVGRTAEGRAGLQARYPNIVHFLNIDWRLRARVGFGDYMAAALEHAVTKYGFRGVKVSKALGLYITDIEEKRIPVDWAELDPLWKKAGELGVPVAIHTGDPKAFWDPVTPENERYAELKSHPSWSFHGPQWPSREALLAERDRLIARHPKTTFICVHFGNNPEDIDYVDKLLDRHPNAMLDTSARVPEIGRHAPEKVRAMWIKHQDRILFGTDLGLSDAHIMLGSTGEDEPDMADVVPFYQAHWRFFEGSERGIAHPTPIQGDWTIDAINLPDAVLEKLYYQNAMRVLGLKTLPTPTPAVSTPPPPPPPSAPVAPPGAGPTK